MLYPPGPSIPSQRQTVHPLGCGAWLVGIPIPASPALRYHPLILDEVLWGDQTSLYQSSIRIQVEYIVKVVQWLIHSRHSSRGSDSLEDNLRPLPPFHCPIFIIPTRISLGNIPPPSLLANLPTFSMPSTIVLTTFSIPSPSVPTGPPPFIQSATTQAISISPTPSTVPTTWAAPVLAAPWLWPRNMDVQSQYVSVGAGFPAILRRLFECMQKGEYINFSQLIHFCEGEELDPMEKVKYVLFPGMEAQLREGRHQDYSFEEWAAYFILYIVAMAAKFPEAIPEFCAYFYNLLRCKMEFQGGMWRHYDRHFRK